MRLFVDPMSALRGRAEDAVNAHFNALAGASIHKDQAHGRKREVAEIVLRDGEAAAPTALVAEAGMLGLPVTTLASIIAAKPDAVLTRELARRTAIIEVRAARTPVEIEAVLARCGVQIDLNRR